MKRDHEVRFPDKFWRRGTSLSIDSKALYAVISTFADYGTGETFVSNERLQLETGFGRDRVERLLGELEAAHFIKRYRRYRKNLLAKRIVHCLKHVGSDTLKTRAPKTRALSLPHLKAFVPHPQERPVLVTVIRHRTNQSHLYRPQSKTQEGLREVDE